MGGLAPTLPLQSILKSSAMRLAPTTALFTALLIATAFAVDRVPLPVQLQAMAGDSLWVTVRNETPDWLGGISVDCWVKKSDKVVLTGKPALELLGHGLPHLAPGGSWDVTVRFERPTSLRDVSCEASALPL